MRVRRAPRECCRAERDGWRLRERERVVAFFWWGQAAACGPFHDGPPKSTATAASACVCVYLYIYLYVAYLYWCIRYLFAGRIVWIGPMERTVWVLADYDVLA